MSTTSESSRARLDGLMKVSFAVGLVGAIGVGLGAAQGDDGRTQFMQSYLFAYLFWLGLSLGSMALAILHYLTGGRWGVRLKRVLEAGMMTMPLMAVLFIPIWMNLETLYPWARPGALDASEALHKKAFWLNVPGWTTRIFVYFGVWIFFSWLLAARGKKRDVTGDPKADRAVRFFAGPMIIAYAITITFAVVDWAMSLEPAWFSTMYGVIYMAGQGIATLAFAILICAWLRKDDQLGRLFGQAHFHDLGTLMFAFSMFWTYVSFSQYLIIWSGNIGEETPWYLHRTGHGWQNVAIALVVLGWFLPFLLLMQKRLKQQAHLLVGIAVVVLVARFVDIYWQIGPAFHHEGFEGPKWMDLAMPFAIGGFWVGTFAMLLKSRTITNDQIAMIHAEAAAAHH